MKRLKLVYRTNNMQQILNSEVPKRNTLVDQLPSQLDEKHFGRNSTKLLIYSFLIGSLGRQILCFPVAFSLYKFSLLGFSRHILQLQEIKRNQIIKNSKDFYIKIQQVFLQLKMAYVQIFQACSNILLLLLKSGSQFLEFLVQRSQITLVISSCYK